MKPPTAAAASEGAIPPPSGGNGRCEPHCPAKSLTKMKSLSTPKSRFYLCEKCGQTWKVDGEDLSVEELDRALSERRA